MDASLQPFLNTISTLEFEEFGHLAIAAATWTDNDVTLHLTVHQQDQEDQQWRLRCRGVRRSRIENDKAIDALWLETQHPLLLPHTEAVAELYFSSRPSDPDAAVGRLVEAHNAVVGRWFDCLHFFNLGPKGSVRAMLDGGFGKLAEGPQALIDRYAEALRDSGVAVSSLASRPPVWWNGEKWVEEVSPLFAVILGASFVVSPSVAAERG
jgi:hypothetical protein